jgi:hypothetical protein
MARPKRKTEVTTLSMTPEVRNLWEQCAAAEVRTLTNMFEVLVREHAKKLGVEPRVVAPSLSPVNAQTAAVDTPAATLKTISPPPTATPAAPSVTARVAAKKKPKEI